MGYSFRLTAMVLLYAPSHKQDSSYHGLCYTSRGALAGTINSSMGTFLSVILAIILSNDADAYTTELLNNKVTINFDIK